MTDHRSVLAATWRFPQPRTAPPPCLRAARPDPIVSSCTAEWLIRVSFPPSRGRRRRRPANARASSRSCAASPRARPRRAAPVPMSGQGSCERPIGCRSAMCAAPRARDSRRSSDGVRRRAPSRSSRHGPGPDLDDPVAEGPNFPGYFELREIHRLVEKGGSRPRRGKAALTPRVAHLDGRLLVDAVVGQHHAIHGSGVVGVEAVGHGHIPLDQHRVAGRVGRRHHPSRPGTRRRRRR